MDSVLDHGRRRFLGYAGAAIALVLADPAFAAPRPPRRRVLALHSVNTGETSEIAYWQDGRYQPSAMHHAAWLMRDHRTGETHGIDPRLLEVLSTIHQRLHATEPIEIVCGYRSIATNALLRATHEGVAAHSFHTNGKAADIRVPGRRLAAVRQVAMSLRAGGVGYYPHSNFVHVDVGPVRHW